MTTGSLSSIYRRMEMGAVRANTILCVQPDVSLILSPLLKPQSVLKFSFRL